MSVVYLLRNVLTIHSLSQQTHYEGEYQFAGAVGALFPGW